MGVWGVLGAVVAALVLFGYVIEAREKRDARRYLAGKYRAEKCARLEDVPRPTKRYPVD